MSYPRLSFVFASLVAACVSFPLSGQDGQAQPKSNAEDLEAVQGLWERQLQDQTGKVVGRATKHVQKNNETVTYYDNEGNVLQAHRVEIMLRREGGVRHFLHSSIEIIAGPNKGARSEQGGGYVYKVEGDRFLEIQGILVGEERRPVRILVWTRKEARDA